jgi:hypothetical protein
MIRPTCITTRSSDSDSHSAIDRFQPGLENNVQGKIPQISIKQAGVQPISIGQLGIGPISVGNLMLNNIDVTLNAAQAVLRDLDVTLTRATASSCQTRPSRRPQSVR